MIGCLYLIEGPTGLRYIGITSRRLSDRWRAHRAQAKRSKEGHLQAALRKYGADAFVCRPLVLSDNYEYLKELERRAIVSFGTKSPKGYNLTDGGDGIPGVVVTEAGRKRRSAAQLSSFSDPDRRRRHQESQLTATVRQSRSEQMKAMWADPLKRQKLHEAIVERWKDPVARERMVAPRRKKRKLDGLTRTQRYRLKDLAAYRERKRLYQQMVREKNRQGVAVNG